ncbi:unnamed protein product [Malus baccata var. baccata]
MVEKRVRTKVLKFYPVFWRPATRRRRRQNLPSVLTEYDDAIIRESVRIPCEGPRVLPCACRCVVARETYLEDERIHGRLGGYDHSTYQTMPPRREPRQSAESSFPDIAQLGEAIVFAIQTSFCTPHMTSLETVHNLKLTHFIGNEGHEGAEKWLNHVEKAFQLTLKEIVDWGVFKELFQKRFIPPVYMDSKKQKFTHLRQGKMSANEYYRMFTDLSRYDPEVAANPVEMLCRIEASENMSSESEDEEGKNGGQRRDDKGKWQTFQGPRKTQNFKRIGGNSSSSSGGLSTNMQRRGGRFTGGLRFQRSYGCPMPSESAETLAAFFPTTAPTQQASGSGGYSHTGRGGAYHYHGDAAPYTSGQHQYSQDLQYQSRYPQYQGGSMSYQLHSAGGSQWYQGGQPQLREIDASSAGSLRQSGQQRQGRGVHANIGRGGQE